MVGNKQWQAGKAPTASREERTTKGAETSLMISSCSKKIETEESRKRECREGRRTGKERVWGEFGEKARKKRLVG